MIEAVQVCVDDHVVSHATREIINLMFLETETACGAPVLESRGAKPRVRPGIVDCLACLARPFP